MIEQVSRRRAIATVIVDPNEFSRRALAALLGQDGRVHVIASSPSHETLAEQHVTAATVALVGESSVAPHTIDELRSVSPGLKVVVMAQSGDGRLPFRAIRQGAEGLVPVSAEAADIADAIEKVVDEGFAIDPDLAVLALRWAAGPGSRETEPETAPALTPRETEILEYLAEGRAAASIAARLGLSRRTVEAHLANAYRKLGVHGRIEALARFRRYRVAG